MTEQSSGKTLLLKGTAGLKAAPDDLLQEMELVGYTFSPGGSPGSSGIMVRVVKDKNGWAPKDTLYMHEWVPLMERVEAKARAPRGQFDLHASPPPISSAPWREELQTAVQRTLERSFESKDEGTVWGPRAKKGFRFGALTDQIPREGGPMAWTLRAMVAYYFIEHEFERATYEEVVGWVEAMTPAQVVQAVNLAVVVGLP